MAMKSHIGIRISLQSSPLSIRLSQEFINTCGAFTSRSKTFWNLEHRFNLQTSALHICCLEYEQFSSQKNPLRTSLYFSATKCSFKTAENIDLPFTKQNLTISCTMSYNCQTYFWKSCGASKQNARFLNYDYCSNIMPQAYNFTKKEALAQVFFSIFCEICKSTFSYRTPPVAASASSIPANICWS